uniref:NADH-ubiquinone oxidoreductase chain 2 n=1 Tax=Raeta sp. TaxID=3067663 RepID=A0AA49XCB2_9BIVA|nr:NADH dehydrogenase subunit 2 [Raeta sp.]
MWGLFVNWGHSAFLSIFTYVLGLYMGWQSFGILGCWAAIELCALALIPLLSGISISETNGSMVYFSLQCLGSFCLFLGGLSVNSFMFQIGFMPSLILLCSGLFLKLGAFPFFFWVPRAMAEMSWFGCAALAVPQKLLPMFMLHDVKDLIGLSGFDSLCLATEVVCCLTALVAAVYSVNLKDLRVLFAYSSVIQSSFLMLVSLVDPISMCIYLVLYSFLSFGFCISMDGLEIYSASALAKLGKAEKQWVGLLLGCYAMSFAGIPPFFGFCLKVFFVEKCMATFPVSCCILIILSVVSMYFYYDIFVSCALGSWTGALSEWVSCNFDPQAGKKVHFVLVVALVNVFGCILFLVCLGIFHL